MPLEDVQGKQKYKRVRLALGTILVIVGTWLVSVYSLKSLGLLGLLLIGAGSILLATAGYTEISRTKSTGYVVRTELVKK
jgi:hypothetical protein